MTMTGLLVNSTSTTDEPATSMHRPLHTRPAAVKLESFTNFLQAYLPIKENDVRFNYHLPRQHSFNPSVATVKKVIFSITPTKGVYDALRTKCATADGIKRGVIVAFIHRPWTLDRTRIPRAFGVVLASHKTFDEVLTTGWNVQLAQRLGLPAERSVCIRGYKGDPERRIGLVGPVDSTEDVMCQAIYREFQAWEGRFGFTDDLARAEDVALADGNTSLDAPIKVVALMNAFHPEEIDRVVEAAVQAHFIETTDDCSQILYLTGAVRPPGLEAALAKGIRVVCVGHKTCEDWGIRFLAAQTRVKLPGLQVVEIDEPEEPPPRQPQEAAESAVRAAAQSVQGAIVEQPQEAAAESSVQSAAQSV